MKKKKIYEVKFEDLDDEKFGIHAISDVESPAIDSLFIALSKEKKEDITVKLMDEDKKLLIGLALIPNKPILRKTDSGEEFYIIFSKETIRHASQLYLKRNNQNNTTLEHSDKLIEGVTTVESWIVEDTEKDKTALYELSAPIGSWAIVKKVYNDDYWEKEVKTGNVRGFSIEGVFMPEIREDLSKVELTDDDKINEIKKLLNI